MKTPLEDVQQFVGRPFTELAKAHSLDTSLRVVPIVPGFIASGTPTITAFVKQGMVVAVVDGVVGGAGRSVNV